MKPRDNVYFRNKMTVESVQAHTALSTHLEPIQLISMDLTLSIPWTQSSFRMIFSIYVPRLFE